MDDYTGFHIAPSTNAPTKYTMKISQEGLDLFLGAAQVTGRKISATKNKWYIL